MKKVIIYLFLPALLLLSLTDRVHSQAIDFTQDDCDGQTHNLYQELDSGHVVVMEFVMDCQLCVDAGLAIESLLSQFQQQYPGVIRVYQFAYSTLMDCNDMKAFRDSGNFQSEVFEENGHLLAHYGGFGMPTIGVAAGPAHLEIYSSVGFIASDTAQLGTALRNYFATISVNERDEKQILTVFPNPVRDELTIVPEISGEIIFELFSSSGEKVLSKVIKSETGRKCKIDFSGVAPGLYHGKFISGKSTTVKEIIVSR